MSLKHCKTAGYFSLLRSAVLTTALLLNACSSSVAERANTVVVDTPSTGAAQSNVSYSSVVALPANNKYLKLAYGTAPFQFGQLYLPPGTGRGATKAPLVIFVHGGCWLNAYDIKHSNAFSEALAKTGYAVWSLEYRRIGDEGGGWPGSLTDVQQGIAFAQTSLAGFGVDSSRIVISGHSAGGQLALLAGSKNAGPAIVSVIGLAAITDMVSYGKGDNSCQSATAQFIGGDYNVMPERYQQASAQQQVMHNSTLLLQGSADNIVPPSQASQSGIPYKMVENAGHFDWIHPQTTAYRQFILSLKELLPL
jgi:acetyl esterase/lipase